MQLAQRDATEAMSGLPRHAGLSGGQIQWHDSPMDGVLELLDKEPIRLWTPPPPLVAFRRPSR